jgi:uncharacterized protein (TIGR03437 family)
LNAALLFVGTCALASGSIFVVPNSQATVPGNVPFTLGAGALHLQEIVGSGQFTGPIVITGIHLRAAVGKGPVSLNYSSWKVTLSTTQAYPNTSNGHALPSLTFTQNLGADATVMYNAAVSLSSPGCSGAAPCPFDLTLSFTTPFSFDPNNGRLLVDVVTSAPSGTPSGSLDAVGFADATASTVAVIAGDPAQPIGLLNLGGVVLGLEIAGAPTITSVVNAASGIAPGLPNAGIAQGAIFLIVGSSLGPSSISIASNPFQSTTLSGTSVSVTVNGTTVGALLYYTSAGQVAALLPSNTPTGTGTITVTYNNVASAKVPITVVSNNLGIFTVTSDGEGVGIVTYPDYSLVSVTKAANCGGPSTTCGAANPGDTLILWGTGLGAVSGSDAGGAGLGVNMSNLPLKLFIGGVPANVVYQGRSGCCIGEDQIVFVVPANAPTGCAVPIAVQINNQVSNYALMAVASSGRTCTPSNPIFTSAVAQILTTASVPFSFSHLEIRRRPNFNAQGQLTGNGDSGKATFVGFTVPPAIQPFIVSYLDAQPPGTCLVFNTLNGTNPPINLTKFLDAGASITVTGPNGSQNFLADESRHTFAPGNFLSPGQYTASATGGADVGAFSAPFTIPTPPALTSPSSGPNIAVTRATGLTVTWSGGTANSLVQVQGENATDNTGATGAAFNCSALGNAGTITVPPSVLLALPSGPFGGWDFIPNIITTPFSAPGISLGFIDSSYDTPIYTTLQ